MSRVKSGFALMGFLIVGLSSIEAQNSGSYFYKRMEGMINDKYPIVMHLERRKEVVTGWCYYSSRRETLFLEGGVTADSTVTLVERPRPGEPSAEQVPTGAFRGKFSRDGFSGIWTDPDGEKKLPFSVTERYDKQSVRLSPRLLQKSIPLSSDKADSPSLSASLELLYPEAF